MQNPVFVKVRRKKGDSVLSVCAKEEKNNFRDGKWPRRGEEQSDITRVVAQIDGRTGARKREETKRNHPSIHSSDPLG